jgi:hypothetical protein
MGISVGPLGIADFLRKRRYLVARHPDRVRFHPELKPWLSVVGVEPFFILGLFWFQKNLSARLMAGVPI